MYYISAGAAFESDLRVHNLGYVAGPFKKKCYLWTSSTTLGVNLISNTSSHYNWAFKLIHKMRQY